MDDSLQRAVIYAAIIGTKIHTVRKAIAKANRSSTAVTLSLGEWLFVQSCREKCTRRPD